MTYRLISRQSFFRVPWKNGQGFTYEIVKKMDQDNTRFLWRLSIADVSQDGPFSCFDGYQRIIAVLNGAGMILTVDGKTSGPIKTFESFHFSGQASTTCLLLDGIINDFNVIYDNERFEAEVSWFQPERFTSVALPSCSTHVFISGCGETTLKFQETIFNLKPWDVFIIETDDEVQHVTLPGQTGNTVGLVHLVPRPSLL